ncbi:MAG: hypothetical protein L6Q95_14905 [Planctomycetes bacterium]|nr:hypothetical protein [Planctomycetota bacterium]
MTRRRRLLANGILVAILLGQAAAIVSGRELWPFSPYPMFSRSLAPTVERFWLCGVREDGAEIALRSTAAFHPFRLAQLEGALARMDAPALAEAARDMLARYEARRLAGRHDGAPLRSLRIYRVVWRTAAPSGAEPLSRELLAESP